MKYGVFSIFDAKAAGFLQPFFSQADGMAVRAFTDVVNEPGHPVQKHPEDYSLFCIGFYDDVSGRLTGLDSPRPICSGVDVVRRLGADDAMALKPRNIELFPNGSVAPNGAGV